MRKSHVQPKVSPLKIRELAVAAQVDPRSIVRALDRKPVRGMAGERIAKVLKAAGLLALLLLPPATASAAARASSPEQRCRQLQYAAKQTGEILAAAAKAGIVEKLYGVDRAKADRIVGRLEFIWQSAASVSDDCQDDILFDRNAGAAK